MFLPSHSLLPPKAGSPVPCLVTSPQINFSFAKTLTSPSSNHPFGYSCLLYFHVYMVNAHVNKLVCFSLVSLSFVNLISQGPDGEPRRIEGKIIFFSPTLGLGQSAQRQEVPGCKHPSVIRVGPKQWRHMKTPLFYEVASYKNSHGECSTA